MCSQATELPNIEFKVMSLYSPDVAEGLQRGEIDVGFLRVEPAPDVTYKVIATEPLRVILPSDHPLAEPARLTRRRWKAIRWWASRTRRMYCVA